MSTLAVVTGSARGIGRAIAARLRDDGHALLLVDLAPAVHDTAAALGATGVQADLTTADGLDAVAAALDAADAEPRVLVNNAGITRDGRIGKLSDDDVRAVLRVNLGAAYALARLLAPRLGPGGAIVNLSSRAYLGSIGQVNYAASKGGLVGLTRALALELAPDVRVNALAPGLTATEMTQAMPDHVREKLIAAVPMGRMGEPAEMAEAVSVLTSDRTAYVTGQVLVACGGRSLAPVA